MVRSILALCIAAALAFACSGEDSTRAGATSTPRSGEPTIGATSRPSATTAPILPTASPIPPTATPVPPTATPRPQPTATATLTENCDRQSYPDVCIPRFPPDLDCGQIPFRRFTVRQPDPPGFDADRAGVGCETG